MRISFFCLALASAAVGCGGTGTGTDLGTVGNDLAGDHLQAGTYNITNPTTVSDGCMIAPIATTLLVTNTGTMLSLGAYYDSTTMTTFTPAGYALGTGTYTSATTATTTGSETVGGGSLTMGCTFMRMDTANFTFTGNNQGTVDWTHQESSFSSACMAADMPSTVPCTSEFKFTIQM